MTAAVCVLCGEIKFGAVTFCEKCGKRPETEIDIAYSLALTDHYARIETLNEISASMRSGRPRPSMNPEGENHFREAARQYLRKYGRKLGLTNKPTEQAR